MDGNNFQRKHMVLGGRGPRARGKKTIWPAEAGGPENRLGQAASGS